MLISIKIDKSLYCEKIKSNVNSLKPENQEKVSSL